jgi:Spy/CpxP family protein refolding chaperone
MQSNPTSKHAMKLIICFVLLASLYPLFAVNDSKLATDPFAGAFFPPELVLLARDRIALTQEQQETLRACVEKTQMHSDELRAKLEHETAALSALAKPERLDEAALDAQLDKVLDCERALKHLRIGLLVATRNLLTPEQQTKLRGIVKDGIAQLEEDTRQRLSEKVERVKEGMQKWAARGRDPSVIGKTMEEKFKPLMDAGKITEAEAELDRLLEQLKQDGTSTESPTAPTQAARDIPEEVRNQLTHNIGSAFLVFRDKVQTELKVTGEQKEKLDQYLQTLLPEAMQVLQKSEGERGKYNQKTHGEMAAMLKKILNEDQCTRLRQMELQRDGLFGPAWNIKELQITDAQRQQFMAPIQETQQKTQALMAEIRKGANPDEIRPKALQLRLDLESKLEALLTDAQKKQWKEMLGGPVDLGVLFDGVPSQ